MLSHFLGTDDGLKFLLVSMRSSIFILRNKQSETPHIHCMRTYSNVANTFIATNTFFVSTRLAVFPHCHIQSSSHIYKSAFFVSRFVNQRCSNQSSGLEQYKNIENGKSCCSFFLFLCVLFFLKFGWAYNSLNLHLPIKMRPAIA